MNSQRVIELPPADPTRAKWSRPARSGNGSRARRVTSPVPDRDRGDVPLVDLTRLDASLFSAAEAAFARLARAGAFTFGEELAAFESEFAAYCGTRHCVGVSDGTNALRIALEALGAGPGGEVVTAALTFVATVEAITMTGASAVLVDIDPETRCMDPNGLTDALGPGTAAVIPVHLHGLPAPMADLRAACGEVPLVEDAAQAHGATIADRRSGSFGSAGAFSFYPTKNLGAMGDAGAVVCDEPELAATMRSLRHHGAAADDANRHLRPGTTARLDNLQAAILRLKLPLLDGWNEQRRAAAGHYREALSDVPLSLPPDDPPGVRQVYHHFAVEVDERDRVLASLRSDGIGAGVHYPTPVHLQPGWRHLGYGAGAFPAAEAAAARVLSLPIFPGISEAEIERVSEALRRAIG
jgi:dTDP-4-amino-4,6-dideoxygalactose transaminase